MTTITATVSSTTKKPHTPAAPAVRFEHVSFTYTGGSHAGVEDLDFAVNPGELVLLCGDSGCGKTTVTRLINGLAPHYLEGQLTGRVRVAGEDTASVGLANLATRIGSVFQNPKSQFFTLNVTEELAFACENFTMPPDTIRERIAVTAHDFDLEALLGRGITATSGGQKQRIACAAVSVSDPAILVLDEPSSNLDAASITGLRRILEMWKRQGKTVIIAEHRLYWLDGLIDRALVMAHGRVPRETSGAELRGLDRAHRDAYGLRPVTAEQIVRDTPGTAPISRHEVVDTHAPTYRFHDMHYTYPRAHSRAIDVHALQLPVGKVSALTGANGAGKSTLVRCLQGLDRRCRGELIAPDGTQLDRRQRLKACFTVLQDVNTELFAESVLDEVLLAQPQEDRESAMAVLRGLDLAPYADRHPLSLSGGQKQRVAIAAALASARPIIIFDEPTSGLDMRHMRQVASLIRRISAQGRTVLVVTHDPEFALLACDNNVCLDHGRVTSQYPIDPEHAGSLAARLTADTADGAHPECADARRPS